MHAHTSHIHTTFMYSHTFTHTFMYTYTHTYIHTHTHTHTHTPAPVLWGGPADLKLMSQVGTSLSIEWHFGGSPTPTVVWEHNQRRITPSDRLAIHTEGEVTSMTITNVVRSDEGNYMCCVMNSVGVEARKVLLTVQGGFVLEGVKPCLHVHYPYPPPLSHQVQWFGAVYIVMVTIHMAEAIVVINY